MRFTTKRAAACAAAAAVAAILLIPGGDGRAADFKSGDEVSVTGSFTDMVFAAGGKVRLSAKVGDDLFAAGGELEFSGTDADHIITAGGELNFTNVKAHDIITSGGKLAMRSVQVADDLVAAGGEITLDSDSEVGGTAVVAGGEITLAGRIGRDLKAAGGTLRLEGHVGGDADLTGKYVTIAAGAVIDGKLTHRAQEIEISPDARIAGEVVALDYDEMARRDALYRMIGVSIMMAVVCLLGGIVLALVLIALLPRLMEKTNAVLQERFVSSLGWGVLWAVGIPVAAIIAFITVVGIPLGLFTMGVFVLSFPVAFAVVVHFVGRLLRGLGKKDAPAPSGGGRVAWALLGAIILVLIGLVPILGAVVGLLTFLLGTGAAVAAFRQGREAPAAA